MPTIRVRGVDLYYEEYGSPADPHLLMAHGLMGSVAFMPTLRANAPRTSPRAACTSSRTTRAATASPATRRRAPTIAGRRSARICTRCMLRARHRAARAIYGGSMGAGTALLCALDHPEAVEKLILHVAAAVRRERQGRASSTFGGLAYLFQLFGPRADGARIVARLPQAQGARRLDRGDDLRAFFAIAAARVGRSRDPRPAASTSRSSRSSAFAEIAAADADPHAPGRPDPPARPPARCFIRTHAPRAPRRRADHDVLGGEPRRADARRLSLRAGRDDRDWPAAGPSTPQSANGRATQSAPLDFTFTPAVLFEQSLKTTAQRRGPWQPR